jgi:hypothetical protein
LFSDTQQIPCNMLRPFEKAILQSDRISVVDRGMLERFLGDAY